MKKRVVLATTVAVLISFARSSGADPDDWPLMPSHSDEFNLPDLDPKWSFHNPASDPSGQSWSLTSNPGFLTMTTTGPTDTDTSPKMLEGAPDGNFRIVVRVLAAPDVIYEHAGILVMLSPPNWVRLIRDSNQNSVYLQSSRGSWKHIPFAGSDVVLRLTKEECSYEGAFSIDDGLNYTVIGDIEGTGSPVTVGMVVASTPAGNLFAAEFDYFRVFDGGPAVPCGPDVQDVSGVPGLTNLLLAILALLLLIAACASIRRNAVRGTPGA